MPLAVITAQWLVPLSLRRRRVIAFAGSQSQRASDLRAQRRRSHSQKWIDPNEEDVRSDEGSQSRWVWRDEDDSYSDEGSACVGLNRTAESPYSDEDALGKVAQPTTGGSSGMMKILPTSGSQPDGGDLPVQRRAHTQVATP
jgi:hypothetical protein